MGISLINDTGGWIDVFGFFAFTSPMFGGHLLAIAGFILILIGGLIVLKKEPLILKKIVSIGVDGVILLICLYIIHSATESDGNKENDILRIYVYDAYKIKIISWSLFILLYYLLAEKSGGTFGKKIMKLKSLNYDNNNLSLGESFIKASYYGIAVWIMLLFILTESRYPFTKLNLNDMFDNSTNFKICQWINFFLFFLGILSIFCLKENTSLAEVLSKSKTAKKIPLIQKEINT